MKKLLGVLLMLSLACAVFGYPKEGEVRTPFGATTVWDDVGKCWRPTSGSIVGEPNVKLATSTSTIGNVGILTESIGLIAKIGSVTAQLVTLGLQEAAEMASMSLILQGTPGVTIATMPVLVSSMSLTISSISVDLGETNAALATVTLEVGAAGASTVAQITEHRAEQATQTAAMNAGLASITQNTDDIEPAVASVTTGVSSFLAEFDAGMASIALILQGSPGLTVATMPAVTVTISTITAELATGTNVIGAVDFSTSVIALYTELSAGIASVTSQLIEVRAESATQSQNVVDALASITTGLATPTVSNADSTGTSATVSNIANRGYIIICNGHATESAYIYPDSVATPGFGIEVFAGSSITRQWGSDVAVSYASTGTVPLTIDQEARP